MPGSDSLVKGVSNASPSRLVAVQNPGLGANHHLILTRLLDLKMMSAAVDNPNLTGKSPEF